MIGESTGVLMIIIRVVSAFKIIKFPDATLRGQQKRIIDHLMYVCESIEYMKLCSALCSKASKAKRKRDRSYYSVHMEEVNFTKA